MILNLFHVEFFLIQKMHIIKSVYRLRQNRILNCTVVTVTSEVRVAVVLVSFIPGKYEL
jgi:hypothetical protein